VFSQNRGNLMHHYHRQYDEDWVADPRSKINQRVLSHGRRGAFPRTAADHGGI